MNTSDLKPYPHYKPSGVEWLGDVPAHWEVLPNRAIFAEVNERGHPRAEMLSVTIAEGVIRQRTLLENRFKERCFAARQVGLQTRSTWGHRIQQDASMAGCNRNV